MLTLKVTLNILLIASCSHLGKSRGAGVAGALFFAGGGLGTTAGVNMGVLLGVGAGIGFAGTGVLTGVGVDDDPADDGPAGAGVGLGLDNPPCNFARRFKRI